MNFKPFFNRKPFSPWQPQFEQALATRANPKRHGDLPKWQQIVKNLPNAEPSEVILDQDTVTIGKPSDLDEQQQAELHRGFFALTPWRKGPYQVFGSFIDTEWRSDWKWQRLAPHISPLQGRTILDVGCGTGYHGWRMLGEGAQYVLGIDPSMRFLMQFTAIQKYIKSDSFDFLPIGIEDMPSSMPLFDTVFSMGVLYHRRNPINHLLELHNLLSSGGELVLETLIVNDTPDGILTPTDRYAQMRNVWSIMTVEKILALLDEAGFHHTRCVDRDITSLDEQRRTDWMQFHSLKEFLDPSDLSKTIEGYPAPQRGLFIARK